MASKRSDRLTNRQRVRLAADITKQNMKSIALGYLDLDKEMIQNLDAINKDDVEAFN